MEVRFLNICPISRFTPSFLFPTLLANDFQGDTTTAKITKPSPFIRAWRHCLSGISPSSRWECSWIRRTLSDLSRVRRYLILYSPGSNCEVADMGLFCEFPYSFILYFQICDRENTFGWLRKRKKSCMHKTTHFIWGMSKICITPINWLQDVHYPKVLTRACDSSSRSHLHTLITIIFDTYSQFRCFLSALKILFSPCYSFMAFWRSFMYRTTTKCCKFDTVHSAFAGSRCLRAGWGKIEWIFMGTFT